MRPRKVLEAWLQAFNANDADRVAALYAEDATNYQVADEPVHGREAIREMHAALFSSGSIVCTPENLFEDGEWAMLEWVDPVGFRGCGFFHAPDGLIVFQRGYWDRVSFERLHGAPDS